MDALLKHPLPSLSAFPLSVTFIVLLAGEVVWISHRWGFSDGPTQENQATPLALSQTVSNTNPGLKTYYQLVQQRERCHHFLTTRLSSPCDSYPHYWSLGAGRFYLLVVIPILYLQVTSKVSILGKSGNLSGQRFFLSNTWLILNSSVLNVHHLQKQAYLCQLCTSPNSAYRPVKFRPVITIWLARTNQSYLLKLHRLSPSLHSTCCKKQNFFFFNGKFSGKVNNFYICNQLTGWVSC